MTEVEQKPLQGKRIVVTRSRSQASELCRQIEALGGVPFEFPVIRTDFPSDLQPLDRAIAQLADYDWIILTSVTGVEMFFARIEQLIGTLPAGLRAKFAAVGSKTQAALERQGVTVAVTAEEYVAEGLLRSLGDQVAPGQQVLLPRSNIARKLLPDALRERGCLVTDVDAYQTLPVVGEASELIARLAAREIDAVTFTSSSTVNNFVAALSGSDVKALLGDVVLAAIGPVTKETAQGHGLQIELMADTYTIQGLVETLVQHFTTKR